MPSIEVKISIKGQTETAVMFEVAVSTKKSNAAYTLWVANKSYDQNGNLISAEYLPVRYAGDPRPSEGVAGPFTIQPEMSYAKAYVWQFPDTQTPLPRTDSEIDYDRED